MLKKINLANNPKKILPAVNFGTCFEIKNVKKQPSKTIRKCHTEDYQIQTPRGFAH